jgi:hypothetical protein
MKYTLCFLAVITLILASCSDKLKIGEDQSASFIKFYGNMWVDNGNDVKTIPVSNTFPNGGYAIAGYTTKTINRNPGDKDMLFLILDRNGNIVGKPKQFGGPGDDEALHVDVLSNGAGFVLTGFTTVKGIMHASIMKLNASGDSVWNFISNIPGSTAEEALGIHIDSATNIYTVVGYQTKGTQQYGWIFDLQDKGIQYGYDGSAFNSDTVSISTYFSSYPLNSEFTDIGIISPTSIYLLGSITSPSGAGISVLKRAALFVASKQNNYSFGHTNYTNTLTLTNKINDSPRQTIALSLGKGACLSSIDTINTTTHFIHLAIDDSTSSPAVVNKWTDWYYYDGSDGFSGGSLDAVKMKYNAGDTTFTILATLTPSASSSNSSIILIKVNGTNGKEIWRSSLGNNDEYVAGGLDFTPDGGYIITGYNNTGGYNQAVLVIKTNKDGFIE